MSRRLSLLTLAVLTLLVAPASAQAATCADYSNQAAAQRAADMRDADGDGIYCEALPCPCARPGARRGDEERAEAPRSTRPARPRAQRFRAQIIDVTDGDTIRVRSDETRRRTYTVRLIGIDTPETRKPGTPVECGGKEATSNLLRAAFSAPVDTDGDGLLDREGGSGDRVTVTTDPTQDSFDRYRRLLAYVTTVDRQNLAVEQLRAGWAALYIYRHPFRQLERFRAAENQASAADLGVWGACRGDFHRVARATAAVRTLLIKATTGRGVLTLGGFRPNRNPTLGAAIRVFGDFSGRRDLGGDACSVRWRSIGLTILFANFGGGNACEEDLGRAQSAVIKGSRATPWRTAGGLRIGHREREIRRRHPNAAEHSDGYWLVTGQSPFGGCDPTCPFGMVRAKVHRGSVSSFRVWIGAAGE